MSGELLMTPGPTAVSERVRARMAEPQGNPDVDPSFVSFYRTLTAKLARVYGTDDDVVVLGGEGILGLEASVASLIEPGDSVVCLANGVYGSGFADFVEQYGGEAVVCESPATEPLDVEALKALLEEREFAAATMVHCETPTGVLNDLTEPLALLAEADVLTIVDAVSSLGGTPVPAEGVDVCIGGSQKCFSSPPGLTTLSISEAAWEVIEATETRSYYADLEPWRDAVAEGWFPYTHLTANLAALDEAVDVVLEERLENVYERHESVAARCRAGVREIGLECFPDGAVSSPTVTAVRVDGDAGELQRRLRDEHGVVLATGLGEFEDDVLRIGHMGYNADPEKVDRTLDALGSVA